MTLRRYLLLLVLALAAISVLLVVSGRVRFPAAPGPSFNSAIQEMHRDNITNLRPDLVLLGDSIVEENVDAALLSEQLGLKVYPMSFGGSASALWYLAIKNNILASPYPPKYLVILFRDSILTAPGYRVQGKFAVALDALATPDDTLVIQRAYLDSMNPLEKFAESYLPLYNFRFAIRNIADAHVYPLPRLALGCGNRCVDAALLNVFNFRNVAPTNPDTSADLEENLLYSRAALDFDRQVNQSFLPEIIRLCRERGVQLIFVRAKTFRFSSRSNEPPALHTYLLHLEEYLVRNGARFVDINSDPRLTKVDFLDNFHVYPSAKETYTQILSEALQSVLP